MKRVKVGIVGCGRVSKAHALILSNLIENVELTAVCDVKEDRAIKMSKEFKCDYYFNYKEMIDKSGIDVVHICTPHYLHPEMSIYALNSKKHVLTEKPMSITLEDAESMCQASRENNKTLGVIFQNRYNPGSKTIKKYLDSGDLGKILSAKLSVTWFRDDFYYSQSDWKGTWDKEGGGVIIDQAIHTIDLINWFINDEVECVDAIMRNRCHKLVDVEDSAEGIIHYKNGVKVSFYANNYHSYDAPVEIELHCEKGIVKMQNEKACINFDSGKTIVVDRNYEDIKEASVLMDDEDIKIYWGVSHIKQLRNFYNSLENVTQPHITGEEALKTQKLICAIYDSAKNNIRVAFDKNTA